MEKKLLALLIFYRGHLWASISITIACAYVLSLTSAKILSVLLVVKLISAGIILHFISEFRADQAYFYHNLGWSRNALWISSLVLDMFLFFILSFIVIVTFL